MVQEYWAKVLLEVVVAKVLVEVVEVVVLQAVQAAYFVFAQVQVEAAVLEVCMAAVAVRRLTVVDQKVVAHEAQFVLFGPVIHAHSPQLAQGIYK